MATARLDPAAPLPGAGAHELREANQQLLLAALRESVLLAAANDAAAALRLLLAREQFLKQASMLIGESLDHRAGLQHLAELGVPQFASALAVEVFDELDPTRRERVAFARAEPGEASDPAPDLALRALESGVIALDGARLAVPLRVRGEVIGALSATATAAFSPDDVAMFEEVAERASVAVDNARLFQQAQTAVRLRDELLAIISHDLKSPLGAIRYSCHALLRAAKADELPPAAASATDTIRLAQEQMDAMLAGMIDLASLHMDRMVLTSTPQDLGKLVDHVLRLLEGSASERQVTLARTGDAPAVICDRLRVIRLLTNLVGNAIKFTAAGSQVTVRIQQASGEARLFVADAGPGMTEAEVARVLDPHALAKAGQSLGSTGLGLYIAKGIARAHGGRIWVESSGSGGCTLGVALPLTQSAPASGI